MLEVPRVSSGQLHCCVYKVLLLYILQPSAAESMCAVVSEDYK